MRWVAVALGLTMALNLAACSGGGSHMSPLPVTSGGAAPATRGTAKFTILVPNPAPGGSAKHRAFISPSANGALVTTYAHTDTNHTTPLGSSVTDISAASTACTTVSTGRNCVITVAAPAGNDDFVFGLYDAAPVNGAIPASAHELGVAGVTQNITAGTVNVIFASVGGIIAGFGGSTTNLNEAADGRTRTIGLVIAPTDFGNNPITAGTTNAPFANPITATVSESGGSGHVLLALNGGAAAASVTIAKATDTVQAVYDGGGTSGYLATVSLTATPVNGAAGATQENLAIAPVLFVSNPTVFYSPSPAQLNTYPEGQHVLAISEPSASLGTTYTATPSGCSNVLSVGTIVGKGTSATLLVVGGTQASASGCSLAISDGTTAFTIAVANTTRAGPSGTPTINEYTTTADTPEGVVTGADGNLWFVQKGSGGAYGSINAIKTAQEPNGSAAVVGLAIEAIAGFIEPLRIALGPDGNVWFGDCASANVAKITTSGAPTTYTASYAGTQGVTAGLDGNVWFDEYCASAHTVSTDGVVGNINATTGALSEISVPNVNSPGLILMENIALGPDGNIWYDDFNHSVVGKIQGGLATNFMTPAFSVASPMTAGSDGNMWIGSTVGPGFISVYNTTGAQVTSVQTTTLYPGGNQAFMVAGPDGAIWYTDSNNDAIGRMTTTPLITYAEYPVTPGSAPSGITVGPDGNIWFMESGSNKIGVVIL